MPRKWVKEELKRDRLAGWVAQTLKWISENRETALLGGMAILAVAIFIPFSLSHSAKRSEQALNLLARGQQEYFSNNLNNAISYYDEALRLGVRKLTPLLLLEKGNALYEMGRYSEATSVYKEYLNSFERAKITAQVLFALACSLEEEGKYREAKETYLDFLHRFPDNYLLPDVYQGLGRCYEKEGEKEEAIKIYQQMTQLYQGQMWQYIAESRIRELSGDK